MLCRIHEEALWRAVDGGYPNLKRLRIGKPEGDREDQGSEYLDAGRGDRSIFLEN